jgi:outer membrane protein assembly factor BamB
VAALDADGDLLWYRSLYRDYGNITNQLGLAASPVLYKNTLLLPMENTGNSFAAGLDATTGQTKWKYDRPREINWVTPALFQSGGRMSAVFATNKDVTAYDPETGTVAWTLGELKPGGAASLTAAGGLLLVPGADLKALKPNSSGGTPEILWESAKVAAPYASPVLYEGRVYNVSKVAATCVDAKTGELVWTQRIKGGSFWASPVAADGKLYAVTEDGIATVLKLGDKPEVLSTNELGDKVLATPAISNGAIFLRTDSKLYCIGGKKAK